MSERAGRAFLYSVAVVGVLLGTASAVGFLKSDEILWFVSVGLVLNSIALIRTVRTTPPNAPTPPLNVTAIVPRLIILLAVVAGTALVMRFMAGHH